MVRFVSAQDRLARALSDAAMGVLQPGLPPQDPDLTSVITGTELADNLIGTNSSDQIFGLGGNDTLTGNAGDDSLDGGAGLDSMNGGVGSDSYIVSDKLDIVFDSGTSLFDADIVFSTANYALKSNSGIEELRAADVNATTEIELSGADAEEKVFGNAGGNILAGNGGNDALFGLGGDDMIQGGEGSDQLEGGAGADTLVGGSGDDIYILSDPNDTVIELLGGGSADKVDVAFNFLLSESSEIEMLRAKAGAVVDRLGGNSKDNFLEGNEKVNALFGGNGRDTFLLNTAGKNVDKIVDFTTADDSIYVIGSNIFGPTLAESQFVVGKRAQDADDRIIYHEDSGSLFYDPDGSGVKQQRLFGIIENKSKVVAGDFIIEA